LRKNFFKVVEVLVPESFVGVQPTDNVPKWFSLKFNDEFAALPRTPDQTGPLKHFEVLRDSIEGHLEGRCDFGDARGPDRKLSNDGPAGRVCKSGKDWAQRIHYYIQPYG
jgi:hypothetical protein